MANSANFSDKFSSFSSEPASSSPVLDFNLADGTTLPPEIVETTGQTFEIASQRLRTQALGESYAVINGQADGVIEVEITPTADESGNGGIIFRRSDANNMLQFHTSINSSGDNRLRLVKVEGGTNKILRDFNVTGYTVLQTRTLKVELLGSEIKLYIDGVLQKTEINTFNQLARGVGIRSDRPSLEFDNFAYPAGDSALKIAPNFLNNTVLSTGDVRVSSGVWDIGINSSDAITENVQYTLNDGSSWLDFNIDTTNGLAHSAPVPFASGEYDIKFRLEDSGYETSSTHLIVSRFVFLGKGQSNMAGFGGSQHSTEQLPVTSSSGYRPWLIDKADETTLMRQDWDVVDVAVDAVTYNEYANVGWMIRFANTIVASMDEPVVCIPASLAGSTIAQNEKGSSYSSSGLTVYGSGTRRANLAVGGCSLVLYQQGENDANDNTATTKSTYYAKLNTLVEDHLSDYGVPTLIVPLGNVHRSNYVGTGGTGDSDTGVNAIQSAQIDVAQDNANAYITESLTDLILNDDGNADDVHFSTDSEFDAIASRTYAELQNILNEGSVPNQPPTASAGTAQTVAAGATVQLDGTGSTDGDGTIVSYAWAQTAGDAVILTGASTSTPSFTAPSTNAQQTLTFELTVTDNDAQTDTDTVDITVEAEVVQPIESTLNLTVSGITAGLQALKLWSETDDSIVFSSTAMFTDEAAVITLSVPAGTVITGRWLGTNPPTTGTGVYGVTV